MTNNPNSPTLLSRPDILSIYTEMALQISEATDSIAQAMQTSLIELAQQPNLRETAYLKQGSEGIIEQVCQDLLRLGFLTIEGDLIRVATYFKHTSHLEPIEQVIFDYLHVPRMAIALQEDTELNQAIAPYCKIYHQSLVDKGYLHSDNKKYLTVGMAGLIILASAMFKPISGLIVSYRYFILPAMVVMPKASLAIAATAWFSTKSKSLSPKLTAKGKEFLNNYQ